MAVVVNFILEKKKKFENIKIEVKFKSIFKIKTKQKKLYFLYFLLDIYIVNYTQNIKNKFKIDSVDLLGK